jgi:hypothetical protein
MSTPKTLFHLTNQESAFRISEEGFTAPFGNYFCEDLDNCGRFLAFRGSLDGPMVAFEVDAEGLDVHRSTDHSVSFFGTDDSWLIMENIGPEHIIAAYEVTFGKGDADG